MATFPLAVLGTAVLALILNGCAAHPALPFPKASQGKLTVLPRLLREELPEYPPNELERRLGGDVVMKVGIDSTGTVRRVDVARSSSKAFDAAATKAMFKMKFSPGRTSDGQPADCFITYRIVFAPDPR